MLIERAIDVCGDLAGRWRRGHDLGENEWSLRLLDLLTELLSGVASGGGEAERRICQSVSDLYVFLIQHLLAAEAASRAEAIDEIRLVLAIEAQTWQLVCADERKQLDPTATVAKAASSRAFNVQV
jgi:flagellar protein FliS